MGVEGPPGATAAAAGFATWGAGLGGAPGLPPTVGQSMCESVGGGAAGAAKDRLMVRICNHPVRRIPVVNLPVCG